MKIMSQLDLLACTEVMGYLTKAFHDAFNENNDPKSKLHLFWSVLACAADCSHHQIAHFHLHHEIN